MTGFIFDCDGVLVGSEPLSVAELGRTLREAGAGITDAQVFARMIGRPVAEIDLDYSPEVLEDQFGEDDAIRLQM